MIRASSFGRRRRGGRRAVLRSFGEDNLRVASLRLERRDLELLSWRQGPGTGQHDLGAARDSIVVDDWLIAVKNYVSNAVLVAVVIGGSESLLHELRTLSGLGLLTASTSSYPPDNDEQIASAWTCSGSS